MSENIGKKVVNEFVNVFRNICIQYGFKVFEIEKGKEVVAFHIKYPWIVDMGCSYTYLPLDKAVYCSLIIRFCIGPLFYNNKSSFILLSIELITEDERYDTLEIKVYVNNLEENLKIPLKVFEILVSSLINCFYQKMRDEEIQNFVIKKDTLEPLMRKLVNELLKCCSDTFNNILNFTKIHNIPYETYEHSITIKHKKHYYVHVQLGSVTYGTLMGPPLEWLKAIFEQLKQNVHDKMLWKIVIQLIFCKITPGYV